MSTSQSFRAVIVGGGLGGLTAALAMRQRGIQVTALESSPDMGEIGAGIQTAPNASRVLFGLGLHSALRRIRTEPQDQVRRRWSDGRIIAQLPLGDRLVQQYGAPYWQYHRADLHQVLLNACLDPEGAGPVIQVRTSARVTGIDNSDRPVAVTAAGDRFEGDVLVGADGIRSVVRDALGFDDTLVFSGEMAYRALIDGELIAADPATRFLADRFHSTIWFGPGRHLVHYMIRGGRQFNVVAIAPARPTLEQTWTAPATAEQLVAEFTGWDDRVAAMLSKAKDEDVSVWAMYRRRRDPVWVDGRVALLGDACHAMLPYQAQGASQAMEDAAVLAEELGDVTTDGVAGALRRYANRRATRAGMVQDAAAANKDFYHLPDGPAQEERDSRLRDFTGESVVSYDWLWRGPSLNQSDAESMSYPFGG